MELWSLMHFLMPALFASHADFKDWFSNPLNGMVEGEQAVNKVRCLLLLLCFSTAVSRRVSMAPCACA
jgi:SNF2 family DNA or RNA helicase